MDEINITPTEFMNVLYELTRQQKKILLFRPSGIRGASIIQDFVEQQIKKDTIKGSEII